MEKRPSKGRRLLLAGEVILVCYGTWSCSQQPAIGSYPKPDSTRPAHLILLNLIQPTYKWQAICIRNTSTEGKQIQFMNEGMRCKIKTKLLWISVISIFN